MYTGHMEGINNRIKVIKRMAYGYRDSEERELGNNGYCYLPSTEKLSSLKRRGVALFRTTILI